MNEPDLLWWNVVGTIAVMPRTFANGVVVRSLLPFGELFTVTVTPLRIVYNVRLHCSLPSLVIAFVELFTRCCCLLWVLLWSCSDCSHLYPLKHPRPLPADVAQL